MTRTNIVCLLLAVAGLSFGIGQATTADSAPSVKSLAKKYAKKYAKVYAKRYAKPGPRGLQGPPGTSSLGAATKFSVHTAAFSFGPTLYGHGASVSCPAGQPVGGGANPFSGGPAAYLTASYPDGSGWKTLVNGVSGSGTGTAYVVCATP